MVKSNFVSFSALPEALNPYPNIQRRTSVVFFIQTFPENLRAIAMSALPPCKWCGKDSGCDLDCDLPPPGPRRGLHDCLLSPGLRLSVLCRSNLRKPQQLRSTGGEPLSLSSMSFSSLSMSSLSMSSLSLSSVASYLAQHCPNLPDHHCEHHCPNLVPLQSVRGLDWQERCSTPSSTTWNQVWTSEK